MLVLERTPRDHVAMVIITTKDEGTPEEPEDVVLLASHSAAYP